MLSFISKDFPSIESIFSEINLRKIKWLISGVCIPQKRLAPGHLENNWAYFGAYLGKYDNILLIGDFNCAMSERVMRII